MANPFLDSGFLWGWVGIHSWKQLWGVVGLVLAAWGWVEIARGLGEAIFGGHDHALRGALRHGFWRIWWGFFVYTAIWWGPLLWQYAIQQGGK